MEVAKTFDRDGVRYRPGDLLPEGLDKITMDHYKRHGMVREVKPQETKPVVRRGRTAQEPRQTKPAGPSHTTGTVQTVLDQVGAQTTTATDLPPESAAAGDSAADDASAADASASGGYAPGATDQAEA